jgi:hypothetical protein
MKPDDGKSDHPFPGQPVPLAASPQTSEPNDAGVIPEGRQQVCVGRHREVGEIAFDHGPEPPSLLVDPSDQGRGPRSQKMAGAESVAAASCGKLASNSAGGR